METGFYKNNENKFSYNVDYIINKILLFMKHNYLFLCIFCTFLWLFYAFYPGTVVYDSFYMYLGALGGYTGNWHSALITRIWQFILFFTDIKGTFLLIPLAATCAGLYIIAKNISKGIITGIICALILFMPPVFANITVVLKDTYLASFTFLLAALMINQAISDKKQTHLFYIFSGIALVCCFYFRPNGSFIAVPLLVAIFMGWKAPIIYRYITCLVLVVFVSATASFVNLKLLKASDDFPEISLMWFDIAGTAKHSGVSTLPETPGIPDQLGLIKHCYSPNQWDTIATWHGADNCNAIAKYFYDQRGKGPESIKKVKDELRKAWIDAIEQHPKAYLKHRLSHFNRFIDYQGHRPVFQPLHVRVVGFVYMFDKDHYQDLTYEIDPPQLWKMFINMDLGNQLWFHPYVYLLILLFFYLSTLATSDRFNRTLNVVAFSGMIYLIGFLFVGVSSDFRYSYPSLLLSILCILAAFGYYSQKRQVFGTKKMRIIAALVTVPLFLIGIIL